MIESLFDGIDFHMLVSRGRFDMLIHPIVSSFVKQLTACLEEHNIKQDMIRSVLLIGGRFVFLFAMM